MRHTLATLIAALAALIPASAQKPIAPAMSDVLAPFSAKDAKNFADPGEVNYPETWFHFVDGNVEKEGITKDLEAISAAGIRGVQFFHGGNFGGTWPGVENPVYCLSENWEDILHFTASEAERLGLRFTMQNCPGWSMAGGPWIKPENAMRRLVMTRTDVKGGTGVKVKLPVEAQWLSDERDYHDISVIAFPMPAGDGKDGGCVYSLGERQTLPGGQKWVREIELSKPETLRTLVISNARGMSHDYAYEIGGTIKVEALGEDGSATTLLDTPIPMGAWQSYTSEMTLALNEASAKKVRITIENAKDIDLGTLRLLTAARKNGWEMQAGWALYGIPHVSEFPVQSPEAYIPAGSPVDLSDKMDADGNLVWDAPEGDWCILRFGHINKGSRNSPAPPEATGWECDKFSPEGVDANFDGYIGKYEKGAVNGLLSGMLMDSWECETQTWCNDMEKNFAAYAGYALRPWLPALFGYVVGDQRTTAKFLRDFRGLVNSLMVDNFYGRMSQRARERGLYVQYETSGGDVYPCDILEYFKHADVPMTEFWHHSSSDLSVGSINFKPVRPAASAGHIYGKPRISAEAFTSFWLTWDEHFWQLKENANRHMAQGVTHEVFHTYTHNPKADTYVPGTSFGSNIGTPFLRGQTWWKFMPEFTKYLARCTYMLERGVPAMDVLWYLGDDMDHKPDQRADFMPGYNYDYCNPDVLQNRISVKDGKVVTPEGISYSVVWWPVADVIEPETLSRMLELVKDGAVLVTTRPRDVATLRGYDKAAFDAEMAELYGDGTGKVLSVGKGKVYLDTGIVEVLEAEGIEKDVAGGSVDWLHRRTKGADWYFVAPKEKEAFKGTLDFRCKGKARIWDPVTGTVRKAKATRHGDRTSVELDLERAGSCFVVFSRFGKPVKEKAGKTVSSIDLSSDWTVAFPEGWGAPSSLSLGTLVPWKDMDMSDEGKAFSGTATYTRTFDAASVSGKYVLDLGKVDMVAKVTVNGKEFAPLWVSPYVLDITSAVRQGTNDLKVEVTGTWFNRLVFDAGQEESLRKTWTISGPGADEELRPAGLMGPVNIEIIK